MFFFVLKSDIRKFVDYITISSCRKILSDILRNLNLNLGYILKRFKVNSLTTNPVLFMRLGAH